MKGKKIKNKKNPIATGHFAVYQNQHAFMCQNNPYLHILNDNRLILLFIAFNELITIYITLTDSLAIIIEFPKFGEFIYIV